MKALSKTIFTTAILSSLTANHTAFADVIQREISVDSAICVLEVHNVSGKISSSKSRNDKINLLAFREDERIVVDIKQTENHIILKVKYPEPPEKSPKSVRLELSVPSSCRLHFNNISGDIHLDHTDKEATLRTVSGEIKLNHAKGIVDAKTVSGSILFDDVDANDLNVRTVSGDIVAKNLLILKGKAHFETTSGKVHLKLAPSSAFHLKAKSVSGEISQLLPKSFKFAQGKPSKHKIEGSYANGTTSNIIETISGDIVLEE